MLIHDPYQEDLIMKYICRIEKYCIRVIVMNMMLVESGDITKFYKYLNYDKSFEESAKNNPGCEWSQRLL